MEISIDLLSYERSPTSYTPIKREHYPVHVEYQRDGTVEVTIKDGGNTVTLKFDRISWEAISARISHNPFWLPE